MGFGAGDYGSRTTYVKTGMEDNLSITETGSRYHAARSCRSKDTLIH